MSTGAIVGGVIGGLIGLILIVSCCLKCCTVIVRQEKAMCIESMGRFKRVLQAGFHFVNPILERPRNLIWKRASYNSKGQINTLDCSTPYIDMREDMFIMNDVDVFSQDHVALRIGCFITFNIEDAYRCVYEIENLHGAIFNTAQSQLNEIFANIPFIKCLSAQREINATMCQKFSQQFANWGVRIHSLEILRILPTQMLSTLEKQMVQERDRRADLIIADAKREATRLQSEGVKIQLQNKGIGEQEALKKISEGNAQAQLIQATSEADALKKMQQSLQADGYTYAEYVCAEKYTKAIYGCNDKCHSQLTLPFLKKNVAGCLSKQRAGAAKKAKFGDLD